MVIRIKVIDGTKYFKASLNQLKSFFIGFFAAYGILWKINVSILEFI
jgi:hypothetical protein